MLTRECFTLFVFSFFQACFWYTGVLPNQRLRLRGISENKNRYPAITLDTPLSYYAEWRFVCADLLEELIDTFDNGATEYQVDRLFFDYPSAGEDFWVDEFYVTTSKPSGIWKYEFDKFLKLTLPACLLVYFGKVKMT